MLKQIYSTGKAPSEQATADHQKKPDKNTRTCAIMHSLFTGLFVIHSTSPCEEAPTDN